MKTRHLLILPLVLTLVLVLSVAAAFAQTTPAGTQIRNRASATYEDLVGNSYTALSNEVITVVLPVYGISILPDDSGETPPVTPAMSQNAIGGQTLFYSYTLTNTGNDNDSYTLAPLVDAVNTTMTIALANVSIYHDINGNGVVDGGEPAISVGGVPGVLGPVAASTSVSLIVTYAVPGTATAGQLAYVGVQGTSVGDAGQIDTRNYHRTTVVDDAVMTANLTGAPALVYDGDQISYTFTGIELRNQQRQRRHRRVGRPHGCSDVRRDPAESGLGQSTPGLRGADGLARGRDGPVPAQRKLDRREP